MSIRQFDRFAAQLADVQINKGKPATKVSTSKYAAASEEEVDAAFDELLALRLAGKLTSEEYKQLCRDILDAL